LATDELLQQYMNESAYSDYFLNLSPYINDSGVSVPLHFSLHRAYILFRTLGLRHMTVVTNTNQVRSESAWLCTYAGSESCILKQYTLTFNFNNTEEWSSLPFHVPRYYNACLFASLS
jgi:hypothetical protein